MTPSEKKIGRTVATAILGLDTLWGGDVMNPSGVGRFIADTVLAKHDENYMPPEVAAALKKSGRWQEKVGQGK